MTPSESPNLSVPRRPRQRGHMLMPTPEGTRPGPDARQRTGRCSDRCRLRCRTSLGRTCRSGLENAAGRQRRVALEAFEAEAAPGQAVGEVQVRPEVLPWSRDTHQASGAPRPRPAAGRGGHLSGRRPCSPRTCPATWSLVGEKGRALCAEDPVSAPGVPGICPPPTRPEGALVRGSRGRPCRHDSIRVPVSINY